MTVKDRPKGLLSDTLRKGQDTTALILCFQNVNTWHVVKQSDLHKCVASPFADHDLFTAYMHFLPLNLFRLMSKLESISADFAQEPKRPTILGATYLPTTYLPA